jgi:integrase
MGTYEQSGPGGKLYYVVDFVWTDPNTGRKRRIRRAAKDAKGRPVKSPTAAAKAEDAIRDKLAKGTFELKAPPGAPTLASFQERYFADHVAKLKPSSRSAQETIWRMSLLPVLKDMALDAIDSEAIAAVTRSLQARDASPKTINNALSALRTALTHAEDWGLVSSVPRVRWLKVPQQSFDFFTFEEVTALLQSGPPAMVIVALRTGMRVGELLALKWSDVSLGRKQVTVARSVFWEKGTAYEGGTKSGKVRTIPLTGEALAALEGHRAEPARKGYVFTDAEGNQLTRNEAKRPLWRALEAGGLRRVGWHVCRHTFCSHLAMKGVSLPAIQQLAGHATITMTMRYAHLAPDHLRAAMDALD